MIRPRCILSVALALGAAGCGPAEKPPPVQPTRGALTYNGKPATGAAVILHPLPLEKNTFKTRLPSGHAGADGTFEISSYDGVNDGAKAGEYAITVKWTGEKPGPGPDLLKGRFSDPKNPVGLVTISAGQNQLAPIELTGPEIDPAGGPPEKK